MNNESVNQLIAPMRRFFGGQIIPLDDFHSSDWIQYGLMTPEFRDFFRSNPNGETDLYRWGSRIIDELFNLRIYQK